MAEQLQSSSSRSDMAAAESGEWVDPKRGQFAKWVAAAAALAVTVSWIDLAIGLAGAHAGKGWPSLFLGPVSLLLGIVAVCSPSGGKHPQLARLVGALVMVLAVVGTFVFVNLALSSLSGLDLQHNAP